MDHSDTFGKFFRSGATQLLGAVRPLAKYWYPQEPEVHTIRNSVDLREKVVVDIPAWSHAFCSFLTLLDPS